MIYGIFNLIIYTIQNLSSTSFIINRMDISLIIKPNPESQCQSIMDYDGSVLLVIVLSSVGFLWSIYNYLMVRRVDLEQDMNVNIGQQGEGEGEQPLNNENSQQNKVLLELSYKISDGCIQFIKYQYAPCLLLTAIFFLIIFFAKTNGLPTAIAFLVGAFVSILTGVISIIIASQSHYRIKYCTKFGLAPAFRTAYKAACAIAFAASSLGLISLIILIDVTKSSFSLDDSSQDKDYYQQILQVIVGYGFGASFVAFFGRIGGGIYHKAAELGADFIGKIENGLPYHSPSNMATIGEQVGNNANQILGSVSDLFGSFSQVICATMLLSNGLMGYQSQTQACNIFFANLLYPLVVFSLGMLVCMLVSIVLTNVLWIQSAEEVNSTLRMQFLISNLVMIGILYLAAFLSLPEQFKITHLYERYYDVQEPWIPYICTLMGLLISILISLYTEFVTSPAYFPAQKIAEACKSGPTASITLGLALGYMSTTVPIILISIGTYLSNMLLGFYGIGLLGIGSMANYPILLTLSVFSGLGQTGNEIAMMSKSGQEQRLYMKAIKSAGKQSLTRSKNITIYIATLVAFASFGGFLFNAKLDTLMAEVEISLTEPQIFAGILLGAMIPFVFSGSIIRAIRRISVQIIGEVQRQYREDEGIVKGESEPNYIECVGVGSLQTLKKLMYPFLMIFVMCLCLGFAIGSKILAGYLIGLIVSGMQLGISGTNSGGSWQSAKYIFESGVMVDEQDKIIGENSVGHSASIQGFNVGSALKDASCSSLNVLMKLSSIICLIFAEDFLLVHS